MHTLDASRSSALASAVRPEVKLKAILEITRNLSSELKIDTVAPKILDSLMELFPQAERLFLVLVAFCGGVLADRSGLLPGSGPSAPPGVRHTFAPFWEAWHDVEEHYVDRKAVNRRNMTEGAISGMLDSLGDTGHTRYLNPEEVQRMEKELQGEMVGIGVRIGERQGRPTVVAVLPDSPAQKGASSPATCCSRWTTRTSPGRPGT